LNGSEVKPKERKEAEMHYLQSCHIPEDFNQKALFFFYKIILDIIP